MNLELSCPGKTFLCGEYAVLAGGRALVVTTQPRFKLLKKENLDSDHRRDYQLTSLTEIHPESPAGKWMKQESGPWSDYVFADPYYGKGGFGASTAQFIFVYTLWKWSQRPMDFKGLWYEMLFSIQEIHQNFLSVSDQKAPPSGTDLIAQILGQISLVSRSKVEGESISWPFADLEFFIIPTGSKISTHDHLKDLTRDDLASLIPVAELVVEKFLAMDSEGFVMALHAWAQTLTARGLVTDKATYCVNTLAAMKGVRAIKGCGALGADTVFVVVDKRHSEEFKLLLSEKRNLMGLPNQAIHSAPLQVERAALSHGLEIH